MARTTDRERHGRLRLVLSLVSAAVAVAVMVRLSVWQWDRAHESGRFLNYSYAVEWLLFAVLTVVGVAWLVVEGSRAGGGRPQQGAQVAREPRAEGVRVGPPLREGEELEEITWVRLRRRLGLGGP